MILNTARADGVKTTIKGFQDPGSSGVAEIESFVKLLRGFHVIHEKIMKDKITSASPASSAAENGNIKIMTNCRNKENFYLEAENFPEGAHDDMIDALSGAFNELNAGNTGMFTNKFNKNNIDRHRGKNKIQSENW
jgi:predicted phage terminase large subunit-like protein